jgi:hypothetical protein
MSKSLAVFAILLSSLSFTGCVERKLIIRSDPPGATVFLNYDSALVDPTPAEVPFTDYGTYSVRLTMKDHESVEALAEVSAPWWSYPPFDVITDLLLPVTIKDHHEFDYSLLPMSEALSTEVLRQRHEELLERAEQFRTESKEELEEEERQEEERQGDDP